jgi:hypothetical protein
VLAGIKNWSGLFGQRPVLRGKKPLCGAAGPDLLVRFLKTLRVLFVRNLF